MMRSLAEWIDQRLPLSHFWRSHVSEYYTPKNFNFWYYFGVLSLVILVLQIVTGIFLAMHYKPSSELAFASVESYIMRDVNWGYLIRYMHAVGASAFFVVIYLHMFRGIMYGSYKRPRELLWVFGMLLYLCLMAEAFMGYLLPWGQMSYWGAQVIISLFSWIPFGIGDALSLWIRGDYVISDVTLNRFFALHVIAMPLVIIGLVFAHIAALHSVGSSNPDGIEIKARLDKQGKPRDGIPFHPYYTVKDTFVVIGFFVVFFTIVFFMPEMGGYFLEHANFQPANALKTPEHIAPLWYFTPYYAMLRATPPLFDSALPGVIVMFSAIIVLFFLPWIDRSQVKSVRYRAWPFKLWLAIFASSMIVLGYFGLQPPSDMGTLVSRVCTVLYFGSFVFLFFIGRYDKVSNVPSSVQS